ncbi:MAG: uroporphyrinogen-III synthase [Pseudomonadota bacterium]
MKPEASLPPSAFRLPPLQGVGVLVTRPPHQARHLAQLIEAAGGRPILFPVLEILDAEDVRPLHALIDRLDEFDLAIFISPNAVNKAMNLIKARRDKLPERLKIAAVGRGSLKELKNFGIAEAMVPESRFDSEGLLELPELQVVAGKKIVIFRGDGGREVLGDTLVARGAHLEYAECYRRGKPGADAGALLHLWARGELNAVTVTSGESLHNLYDMVGKLGQQWLKKTPLFVPHERIAQLARELGLERVIVTASGDEGMAAGLIEWRSKEKS